jgi:hypothetical protein
MVFSAHISRLQGLFTLKVSHRFALHLLQAVPLHALRTT